MAEIPDMAPIFIKQYHICLYQRASYDMGLKFFKQFIYVRDISYYVMEFKLIKKFFIRILLYVGGVFSIL